MLITVYHVITHNVSAKHYFHCRWKGFSLFSHKFDVVLKKFNIKVFENLPHKVKGHWSWSMLAKSIAGCNLVGKWTTFTSSSFLFAIQHCLPYFIKARVRTRMLTLLIVWDWFLRNQFDDKYNDISYFVTLPHKVMMCVHTKWTFLPENYHTVWNWKIYTWIRFEHL